MSTVHTGHALQEGFDKMGSQSEGVVVPFALPRLWKFGHAYAGHGPGARLVARAWTDSGFRARLLADGNSAAQELGIMASNAHTHTVLKVVENTQEIHNLVVCTLCSCYPLSILVCYAERLRILSYGHVRTPLHLLLQGPSPAWYKSRAYRARAVREPRQLLASEFGLELPPYMALRVHDSTADLRYMVLPRQPQGTEAWTEEQLQGLVTRNSMLGVAEPTMP